MNKLFLLKLEMKLTAFIIHYVWPIARLFLRRGMKKRCSRCTLSETVVKFASDGICEACHGHQHTQDTHDRSAAIARLEQTLAEAQGKGRGLHDVLMLFSGGKDSTWLMHKIITQYPNLRILALTINTGLQSPFAKSNAKAVCEHFGIDHLELSYCEIFLKLFKFGFSRLAKEGFYCTDFFEGELMQDLGRQFAASHQIPYLIWGITSEQTDTIRPVFDEHKLYTNKHEPINIDNQHFTRTRYMGHDLTELFSEQEMRYWWDSSRYPKEDVPVMLFPFHAWQYDKNQVVREVKALNLIKAVDPYLTNDLHITLGVFMDYQIMGYCSVEPEWAKLVRRGLEDYRENRNTWELVEYYTLHMDKLLLKGTDMAIVLEKLGMTVQDVRDIIKQAGTSHELTTPVLYH